MMDMLPTGGEFRGQIAYAIVLVSLLQKAKRMGWIDASAKNIQKWIAWIAAFLATFGVHVTFSGSLACGGILTVPGLNDIVHAMANFVLTLGSQEGIYNLARLPELVRGTPSSSTGTERGLQRVAERVRAMLAAKEKS